MSKSRVGELRPSQILYTFGVGSVVDLPNMSVIVMGLDDWQVQHADPLVEERLLSAVRRRVGFQVEYLRQAPMAPPSEEGFNPFDENAKIGIPVASFPNWVLCPVCRFISPIRPGIFELKKDPYRPERTRYVHKYCNSKTPPTVIPVRFLAACTKGHLDDFPWHFYVHRGNKECTGKLKLFEFGISGTAADAIVKCEGCELSRSLAEAFGEFSSKNMPKCRGRHPQLRKFEDEGCTEQMKAILLGASNSWFPVTLSAFSIPSSTNKLTQLVEKHWLALENIPSFQVFEILYKSFRATGQLVELDSYSQEDIWKEIDNKRGGKVEEEVSITDLKTPEWKVFSQANRATNTQDFQLNPVLPPENYKKYFEKIVLVEKLREVRALIGFTRIESPYDYQDIDEMPEWAPISRNEPKWIPASEIRGEGIFIQFSESAIGKWEKRSPLFVEYEKKNREAFYKWRQSRNLVPDVPHPGLRYILLHSFSHALMRQLAIECGYTSASLRERIYSKSSEQDDGPMAGVLIYTAAPDSEGTLGGLVSLGEGAALDRHIEKALEQMTLCASDPLCAEHDPLKGSISLHWAACHACLFSPETSCERGNKYLDRALLIPSVKVGDLAFFK